MKSGSSHDTKTASPHRHVALIKEEEEEEEEEEKGNLTNIINIKKQKTNR